ncbi:MAG: hypothetical protein KAI71_04660, partial [Candidatus Pacebacteria bacterium]|nr:hypothetical protein [Candidatus Paceibacterota bacterium]
MGEKFFESKESDQITDEYGEIEEELSKKGDKKNNYDKGSEEFLKDSKRDSKIQKIIDGGKQKYNKERKLKRQTEPVEDWRNSIETIENDTTVKSE